MRVTAPAHYKWPYLKHKNKSSLLPRKLLKETPFPSCTTLSTCRYNCFLHPPPPTSTSLSSLLPLLTSTSPSSLPHLPTNSSLPTKLFIMVFFTALFTNLSLPSLIFFLSLAFCHLLFSPLFFYVIHFILVLHYIQFVFLANTISGFFFHRIVHSSE